MEDGAASVNCTCSFEWMGPFCIVPKPIGDQIADATSTAQIIAIVSGTTFFTLLTGILLYGLY